MNNDYTQTMSSLSPAQVFTDANSNENIIIAYTKENTLMPTSSLIQYATGIADTVYVRINNPWGFGEGWHYRDGSDSKDFTAFAPDNNSPSITYNFNVWVDYPSDEDGPYTAGQVIPARTNSSDPYDVTNFQKVFTRPS